jgi:hypothetical protein
MPSTLGLSITFAKRGAKIVANTLYFQTPSLVAARLGQRLRSQRALPARIRLRHLAVPCRPLQCGRSFHAKVGSKAIDFGLNPNRPSRPYLVIRASGP